MKSPLQQLKDALEDIKEAVSYAQYLTQDPVEEYLSQDPVEDAIEDPPPWVWKLRMLNFHLGTIEIPTLDDVGLGEDFEAEERELSRLEDLADAASY